MWQRLAFEAMRVLVVTPTYNERDNLEELAEAVLAAPGSLDYLIVDDNSPDGTGDLADEIASRTSRFQVLHRAGKLGLGSAYREAFAMALEQGYDCLLYTSPSPRDVEESRMPSSA